MSKLLKKLICLLFVGLCSVSLASCVIEFVPTNSPDTPEQPDNPVDPNTPVEQPSIKDNYECITIAEAIELAQAAGSAGTTEKYYVYGVIKEVSNGMYGEMTIADETGELYIYGVYSKDESTRYDAMAEKPVSGDEVVLYGMLKTYNDKAEMDRGYLQEFKHVEIEVDENEYVPSTVDVARNAEVGTKTKLTGVVAQITYANGMVPNGFYLVDNTGSIYIYGNDAASSVKEGNTVTVIGEKTYYVLASEQGNAEKFGYKGCCQLQNATVVENDKGNTAFDKSWITEYTIKEIMETPVTENMTTNIFKVNALVKKVPGNGFVNYYFNDIDGVTGSYTYTACNGSDFAWLDEFDGKICTVYLSPMNAKSTASGCIYRFMPIEVVYENYKFEGNAAEYAVKYHGVDQFLAKYDADPAFEVVSSVSNELLGLTDVQITYSSSDTEVAYFENVEGKLIFHTKGAGSTTIKISSNHNGSSYSTELEVVVNEAVDYETISVKQAFDTADGEVVTVKGIVAGSLVNQSGFYLIDETGVIAVKGAEADITLLSVGNEVVVRGTKGHQQKADYTGTSIGQNNIYDCEILVNYYGKHDYSTATFKTDKTVEELKSLDPTVDYSGDVYVVEAIIEVTEAAYYTSIAITGIKDTSIKFSLYCSSANQYSFLKQYAGEQVTLELAMCNWNSKSYYTGCVISVTKDGVKTNNTLNFTNKN